MKLLVRNLARTTTEKELFLLFAEFGRVQSCDLVLDKASGKSKGFAFVEMPKAGEAKVAIKKLNNRDVAGNKIRVKKAEQVVEGKEKNTAVTATPEASDEAPKKFSWKDKKIT
jgi:RNA recognition motif-containing protein